MLPILPNPIFNIYHNIHTIFLFIISGKNTNQLIGFDFQAFDTNFPLQKCLVNQVLYLLNIHIIFPITDISSRVKLYNN